MISPRMSNEIEKTVSLKMNPNFEFGARHVSIDLRSSAAGNIVTGI